MANIQNLKPFNTMTAEQRSEISRLGGKASGAARRAKRERIEQIKAEAWAKREMHCEDLALLRTSVRELRRMYASEKSSF